MSLDVSGLAQSIYNMMTGSNPGPPPDISTMAQNWATAYDNYAKGCLSIPSGLVPAATQPSLIQAALESVPPVPTAPLFPLQFNTGLIAYWLAMTFAPGTDLSVVTPAVPTVALPTLTPILLALPPVPDMMAAAQAMAAQIHAWTLTVVITSTIPPPTGPTPVPNAPG